MASSTIFPRKKRIVQAPRASITYWRSSTVSFLEGNLFRSNAGGTQALDPLLHIQIVEVHLRNAAELFDRIGRIALGFQCASIPIAHVLGAIVAVGGILVDNRFE